MLAARGDASERVIQREGRWKSDACKKVYACNNADDARQVFCKLAAGKGLQRQPGQATVWGKLLLKKSRSNLGCAGINGVAPIGVSVVL